MAEVVVESLEVRSPIGALVEDLSMTLRPGVITALVGESGSGKSVTASALLGLLPDTLSARWRSLTIDGRSLKSTAEIAPLRGRVLSLMPQDAAVGLDPILRVGIQLDEVLTQVARLSPSKVEARRRELLAEVGFADPQAVARSFPHQLSGGMRQRVLLAATLASGASVLLVDEPTTALDASLKRGVLELLRTLATRHRLALLFISHDLAAAEAISDEVLVLYGGRVCEIGSVNAVFNEPRHPYTRGLSLARLDRAQPMVLRGALPAVAERSAGCRFAARCARASALCQVQPPLKNGVACHHPLESR